MYIWNKPSYFKINDLLKNNLLNKLYLAIDNWKGVKINNIENAIKTYPLFCNYFVVARRWFDKTKQNIWSNDFWIHLFNDIDQHITLSANTNFNVKIYSNNLYNLYCKYLLYQVK